MNTDKNTFASELQQQIGQKRNGDTSGVLWFSEQLSDVTGQSVKPTNVYKWLSGATAREVPSKFIKRKPGETQDSISKALQLSTEERVRLLDSFYLTYAYKQETKQTLLHLLDSQDLESLGDYGRFKSLKSQPFRIDHLLTALDKFFACIDCEKEADGVAIDRKSLAALQKPLPDKPCDFPIQICATDNGFLDGKRLDAFASLLNALYAAEYSVEVLLCFGAGEDKPSRKATVLKKLFSIVFDNGVSSQKRPSLFSLRVLQSPYTVQPFDCMLLADGMAGYCLTDNNAYLTWCGGGTSTLFASSYERYRAQCTSPFDFRRSTDVPKSGERIANADAPGNNQITYVLGKPSRRNKNLIATDSEDRLGDNWVRYSYLLDEEKLYLIPYYLDDYVDVPSLLPLKRSLSSGETDTAICICDPDLVQAAKTYREYLREITVAPIESNNGTD